MTILTTAEMIHEVFVTATRHTINPLPWEKEGVWKRTRPVSIYGGKQVIYQIPIIDPLEALQKKEKFLSPGCFVRPGDMWSRESEVIYRFQSPDHWEKDEYLDPSNWLY